MKARRDLEFLHGNILECLPGYLTDVSRRSGHSLSATRRGILALVGERRAYLSGWLLVNNYVPIYSAGPLPEGYTPPPKPPGTTKGERESKRRKLPHVRKKLAAKKKRAYERDLEENRRKQRERYHRRKARERAAANEPRMPRTCWVGGAPFAQENLQR